MTNHDLGKDPTRRDLGRYRADFGVSEFILLASVLAAAGPTAVSVVSAQQQAAAVQDAGEYNAQVAEVQASEVTDQAAIDEEAYRAQAKRIQAANRASIGASGITTEGSPLLVLMDNASQAEYEAQRIRYQGAVQAEGLKQRADLLRYEGASAQKNLPYAYGNAGASLLGDTVGAVKRYYTPSPKVSGYSYGYM